MYYTFLGNLINNPLAYSKTGAPMYKSTNKNNTKYNLVFDKIIIHEVGKVFYNFITLNNINIKLNNSYTTDKKYFININYSK